MSACEYGNCVEPGSVQEVSAGGSHTCVVTFSGGGKCWGSNSSGQVGNGGSPLSGVNLPTDVWGLASGIKAISAGYEHTCAITDEGGVKCWGDNISGQLGNGTRDDSATPVDVSGLTERLKAISSGTRHSCGITESGVPLCWGGNSLGELGNNSNIDSPTPTQVFGLGPGVAAVATGESHSCALTVSGGVKCWGYNPSGELGNNSTDSWNSPVDVFGLQEGVVAITAGSSHTCAAMSSGGVKCWGLNEHGELGDNTHDDHHVPVDVVGPNAVITRLSAGGHHTCAVTEAGSVWCWGINQQGQLGDGTTASSTVPVHVTGLSYGVLSLDSGGAFSCAISPAHGLKCWGDNGWGQLGINDFHQTYYKTPVDVLGL